MTLVRAVTELENGKLENGGQYSEVFAIPRVPNTVYTARLASVPTSTDMVALIAVNSGSGTPSDIRADMKMLVGTSAGADDLGFCRVRATPTLPGGAGNVKISELSHIDWQSSCYLTFVDDYDIMPRHLKIVAGEAYIDYERDYSDQHVNFDPVVNMGGHRVLELEGGEVTHIRSASLSFVFDGTISSYLWEAPGASAISGSTTATATITYDTPGHYVEYLTLTSNDAKTWTGVRYVFIPDPETLTSNIKSPKGTESFGGISVDFKVTSQATYADIRKRSFIIVFSRDYFGGVEGSVAYKDYEKNILAHGRVSNTKLEWNDELGEVEITIQDEKHWMSQLPVFPFGLERPESGTASAWTEMPGLNTDRAVWALLHEYCTITRIADFHPSNDTRYSEEMSSIGNKLLTQLEEIAALTILADLVFDRYGEAWLRVEPQLVPEANRSGWAVVQDLTSRSYIKGLEAEIPERENTAQINLSGVSVPAYGKASPHFSLSYGRIPAPYGDFDTQANLLLASQSQSNSLSGLFMGWRNCNFDPLPILLVGNNRMYSLAEYCRASITISADENPRGFAYDGYIVPREIRWEHIEESGKIYYEIDFQDESVEQISVTGDFPEEAAITDDDFSSPPPPSIIIPPPIPIPPPIDTVNTIYPSHMISATSQGVFYTITGRDDDPIWISMNEGFADGDELDIGNLVVCPNGSVYCIARDSLGWEKVYRASALGATWVEVFDGSEYGTSTARISGIGVSKEHPELVAICVGDEYENFGTLDTHKIYTGSGGSFTEGDFVRHKYTNRYVAIVFRNGLWNVYGSRPVGIGGSLASPRVWFYDAGGGLVGDPDGVDWGSGAGGGAGDSYADGRAGHICWGNGISGYSIINDTEATSIDAITAYGTPDQIQSLSLSPSGEYGMGAWGASETPYKTIDGGATMELVSATIPLGSDIWENCGDKTRWIFGGGMVIRVTTDQGATYADKVGNLLTIAPLVDVIILRYVDG